LGKHLIIMLSEKSIKEFQDVFEKKYGKKLSREETIESANNLLGFFNLLLKVDMRENFQKYKLNKNNGKDSF
jgi:hypothetical protein